MKYSTYILESESTGKLYIGQTSDLEKRIERHNSGGSRYTKGKGPWKLLFSVSFETRSEAMMFEKKLKNYRNRDRILAWIEKQKPDE